MPEKFNINSIIKFLDECIVKIQMLPLFIKDAIITDEQQKKDKCTFILSDLFDIYKAIKEHDNSFFFPSLKEYKDSFESMFFKLKKSGVDFPNDEELNNLQLPKKYADKIQDFIIMPNRDSFSINENKIQEKKKNKNKETSSIMNSRSGISKVSDNSNINIRPIDKDDTKNEITEKKPPKQKPLQTDNQETDVKKDNQGNINEGNKIIDYTDDAK